MVKKTTRKTEVEHSTTTTTDSPKVESPTVNMVLTPFQTALVNEYNSLNHILKTGKKRVKAIKKLLEAEGLVLDSDF